MKKPNPLAIIGLCILAISILAFTINDVLGNRKKNTAEGALNTSKNLTGSSPFIAYNPPHGQPGHRHDLPDGAPLPGVAPNQNLPVTNNLSLSNNTTTPATTVANGVALNPAHGQPGHRCEIAVGAPLNSAPAGTQTSPATAITSAAAAPPVSGKNPEHGKPGHRCDIAVGAPLDSAPASTVSSSTAPAPATNTVQVAKGLNPAHGQPGHRCDIAVGAPLDQAKTAAAQSTTKPASSLFPNYSFSTSDSATNVSPIISADSSVAR